MYAYVRESEIVCVRTWHFHFHNLFAIIVLIKFMSCGQKKKRQIERGTNQLCDRWPHCSRPLWDLYWFRIFIVKPFVTGLRLNIPKEWVFIRCRVEYDDKLTAHEHNTIHRTQCATETFLRGRKSLCWNILSFALLQLNYVMGFEILENPFKSFDLICVCFWLWMWMWECVLVRACKSILLIQLAHAQTRTCHCVKWELFRHHHNCVWTICIVCLAACRLSELDFIFWLLLFLPVRPFYC